MKIIRARTAGFCMGVGLALRTLDRFLGERTQSSPGRLVMLGPIIHNPQVLEYYASQGVVRADSLDAVRPGDTVVIRAHGIPKQDEAYLLQSGATVADATCPKVKRAQVTIAEATAGGKPLYLFGEADHPEVRGLVSYAAGTCRVFGSLEELREMAASDSLGEIVLAAQTTQERVVFETIQEWLQEHAGTVHVLSTICDATRKRQQEAAKMAHSVDAMVVVGGKDSGNTRRLADVARSCGILAWHVETPDELNALSAFKSLRKDAVIGITAGASTPGTLIDAIQLLVENGQRTDSLR